MRTNRITERLSSFLIRQIVLEGGIAGHMRHPIDYPDFTGEDLKELVRSIFSGKIKNVKEKLDGTNIGAYKNKSGNTVFVRNKADLNSESGGMTIADMAVKWSDNQSVADNFIRAAKTIEEVFSKISIDWFNPSEYTKIVVNCECITAGQTNVMFYDSDRVAFHGTTTYEKTDRGWEIADAEEGIPDEIRKASENVRGTEPRPDLILKSIDNANKLSEEFCTEIDKLFKEEGLTTEDTIEDWKLKRFSEYCPEWLLPEDVYKRWFYSDKSINLNNLKRKYSDKLSELRQLDRKDYKTIVSDVMEPMDTLFARIGNSIIDNLEGFTNSKNSNAISARLASELERLVDEIKKDSTSDELDKLDRQIRRLERLDNKINSAEGIVFTYKGRLMKLTGSFAALNQIMGMRKFNR